MSGSQLLYFPSTAEPPLPPLPASLTHTPVRSLKTAPSRGRRARARVPPQTETLRALPLARPQLPGPGTVLMQGPPPDPRWPPPPRLVWGRSHPHSDRDCGSRPLCLHSHRMLSSARRNRPAQHTGPGSLTWKRRSRPHLVVCPCP